MKRALTALLAGVLLVGSATAALAEDWTQYRYDPASSGINPDQAPITANRWRVRWSKNDTATRDFTSYPLLTEDSVYIAGYKLANGHRQRIQLWSFDRDNGHLNWAQGAPCGYFDPHLAMFGGWIVFASIDDDAHCADDVDWTIYVQAATGSKTRVRNQVVWGTKIDERKVITLGGHIVPFDTETRQYGSSIGPAVPSEFLDTNYDQPMRIVDDEAWIVSNEEEFPPGPVVVSDGVALLPANSYAEGRPLNGGPTIHYGSCGASRCAVDINTHEVLWTGSPYDGLVQAGVIYSECPAGVCARNLRTGDVIWSVPSGPIDTPILAGGVLWIGSDAGARGYDPVTGELLSRRPFTQQMGPAGIPMAIANGWMLTSANGGIKAITFDRP